MSETKEEKFGQRPNAPTVKVQENVDEYKIIAKAFEKENVSLIMPVISADQYAAFDALVPRMISFYTSRSEKVNPNFDPEYLNPESEKYDPNNRNAKFAIPISARETINLPPGTKEGFDFFEDFRKGNPDKQISGYKVALTAENGYFGELVSRWLESVKSAEQKGSGGEPKRGWGRFFLGGH